MKNYLVVEIGGNQHKISQGDELLIEGKYSDKLGLSVLLSVKDGKVIIGKPKLDKISPEFKILSESVKGKKIDVFKYKAKSRYRKKIGFRPQYTKLLVKKI